MDAKKNTKRSSIRKRLAKITKSLNKNGNQRIARTPLQLIAKIKRAAQLVQVNKVQTNKLVK